MSVVKLEELRQRLHYSPETGLFTWLESKSNVAPAGSRAGCINKVSGYRQIRFNRQTFREHRLAWFWYYGEWPKDQIDHINRVKTDNRLCNLREATTSENNQNKASKGCTFDKNMKKWKAYISVQNVKKHLGYFDTEEEAEIAYQKAKKHWHNIGVLSV